CRDFFFSSRRRHTRFSRDWSSDVCVCVLDTQRPPFCQIRQGATSPGSRLWYPLRGNSVRNSLLYLTGVVCAAAVVELGGPLCPRQEGAAGGGGERGLPAWAARRQNPGAFRWLPDRILKGGRHWPAGDVQQCASGTVGPVSAAAGPRGEVPQLPRPGDDASAPVLGGTMPGGAARG